MAMACLYRQTLPSPPSIDFASPEGKQLFLEAIQDGSINGFFRLMSCFWTQSEPSLCALTSLAMVLNAIAIDPIKEFKGPWRWFDESMLDCCEPLEKVKERGGISFEKLVCLAHCVGAKAEAFLTNQSTIDDFRKCMVRSCASEDCYLISSYHRATFKQTGTGHFSPIGGYHAGRDMALILDVTRFKYPPHWVPITLLWEAMDSVDEATGQHRGFMVVSRPHREPGLLYTLLQTSKNQCASSATTQPSFTKSATTTLNWNPTPQPITQQSNNGSSSVPQLGVSSCIHESEFEAVDESLALNEGEVKSVYVGNLPSSVTATELKQEFKNFGRIKPDSAFVRNQKDVVGVSHAFSEFEDQSGVQNDTQANNGQIQAQLQAQDNAQKRIWVCAHCKNTRRFDTVRGLYRHYTSIHRTLRIECGICNNKFANVAARDNHAIGH